MLSDYVVLRSISFFRGIQCLLSSGFSGLQLCLQFMLALLVLAMLRTTSDLFGFAIQHKIYLTQKSSLLVFIIHPPTQPVVDNALTI